MTPTKDNDGPLSSSSSDSESEPEASKHEGLPTTNSIPFPSNLAEKIIWSPPFRDSGIHANPDGPPDGVSALEDPLMFKFSESILRQASAAVSYAFSPATQLASARAPPDIVPQQKANPVESAVYLCYPHRGCDDIIDAMVKILAEKQGADVVVLDPLEFALGRSGVFGEAIEYILNPGEKTQQVFDHIVNMRHLGQEADVSATRPRVVYLRDSSTIYPSAQIFLPYLLAAVRNRRTSKGPENPNTCETPIRPTILIFGWSFDLQDPLKIIDNLRFSWKVGVVGNLLRLPLLCESFFFRSLAKYDELNSTRQALISGASTPTTVVEVGSIYVIPICKSAEESVNMEDTLAGKRKRVVLGAWLQACLEQKGAVLLTDSLDSAYLLSSDVEKQAAPSHHLDALDVFSRRAGSHILLILDRIAKIAIGISSSSLDSAPAGAVQVTRQAVAEAYHIYVESMDTYRQWWTKNDEVRKDISQLGVGAPEPSKLQRLIKEARASKDWNPDEEKLLNAIVDPDQITTSFEDVCLPQESLDLIRTIISLPLMYPAAFKSGVLQKEAIGGVLLYGPPGTGKTLLCRALARESGARMLQVQPSDIMSKWVGETQKLIAALFTLAYQLAPCIIFIDEVDSLFRARREDDGTWRRDMLNEFLQAMDGLRSAQKNKDKGVVVIGATNRPYDLDDAFLRRLPTRIMVKLPTEPERLQILKTHLRGETLSDDVDLARIASDTPTYSGSDLKNLCISAAMESVKEAAGGLPWVRQEVNTEDPSPNLGSATGDGYGSTRRLTQAHFIHAIREVPSSSAGSGHSKLNKWHERFGRKTRQDENHLNTQENRAPAGNRPPDPIQNVGPPPAAAVGWVMGTAFINVPMSYLS